MKTKLCLPIIQEKKEDVLAMIEQHRGAYDMFEVYIDYIAEPFSVILSLVHDLSKNLKERLILVLRRKDNEKQKLHLQQRQELLVACGGAKVFVDLDIEKQQEELMFIKNSNLKINLIASFHDYKKTPRTSKLIKIVHTMEAVSPTMYKIATYCNDPKDALHLMHFLLDLKEQKKKVIILGMGSFGKITRIFGAINGNEITYAPEIAEDKSAEGQLTRKELETIMSFLRKQESI